uniref:Secreted protein n=1 Tax=Parascaris univalens TaxID=6257 RepID=A0A915B5B9_PARUN
IYLVARCFSAAPPTHIIVLDYFDELSKQQVSSAGTGAGGKNSRLAALYGEFMKAYEEEEIQHGGSTIHGPHVVALIELIGETMNINMRLAKLSGSSQQQNQENVSNAERSFRAITFADMNTALNNDFKFLKELNYTSAYVLPALTLLSAQLQQINTHIESLQSHH